MDKRYLYCQANKNFGTKLKAAFKLNLAADCLTFKSFAKTNKGGNNSSYSAATKYVKPTGFLFTWLQFSKIKINDMHPRPQNNYATEC